MNRYLLHAAVLVIVTICISVNEAAVDFKSYDFKLGLRSKRSVPTAFNEWTFPIKYVFDGTHTAEQEDLIREAIKEWTDKTCVTFQEITDGSTPSDSFISFSGSKYKCWSHSGRSQSVIPQPIYLAPYCLSGLGTAIHEIGHALGLNHEHVRSDRDNYVRILENNIKESSVDGYNVMESDQTYNLPYNYNSVMHYRRNMDLKSGLPKSTNTIETIDPIFQQNIGQSFELSFLDAQLMNNVYCSNVCTNTMSCNNGGYTDPTDCNRCRCPDGLSGTLCDEVAPGSASFSPSSAKISVTSSSESCISVSSYQDGDTANWLLEAPGPSDRIKGRFVNTFRILSYVSACKHFVEVKFKCNLAENGGRFCGRDTLPKFNGDEYVTSEGNKMILTFRAPWDSSAYHYSYRVGFEFCYSLA